MAGAVADETWLGAVLVFAAAVIAPLISDRFKDRFPIPLPVIEMLFGIMLGPAVLNLVMDKGIAQDLSELGLAMLFFLAGYEIEFAAIQGRPLRLASLGWLMSIGLGVGAAWAVSLNFWVALLIGVAVSTTALGTILPMVRDAGMLERPVGKYLMAVGAIGEFAPIVAIAVLYGGGNHETNPALLLVGLVAVGVALLMMRPRSGRVSRLLSHTLGTSVQFAMRLSMLAIVSMVWIAAEIGVDIVLGAFTAGLVIRWVISSISDQEAEVVASKLDAIGFGMLVPIFFVMTGVRFDVVALFGSVTAMLLIPVFLLLFLLSRGVVTWVTHRRVVPQRRERAGLSLFAATQLPLVIVVADIGKDSGVITDSIAAALQGAALLSVMLFPLIALWRGKRDAPDKNLAAV
ncbi:cation:proton antiporter [Stackebrandtia nassauensis]|uniref:Sodium/hydrogen exchanger n=1 Tax=Stackebrandtia nassauensis (strain DSM 44728 / CIP 108903 / NRRL B-16338 / NBRC 102104 / LLR-40K-21) TaxID=446470 RepID=D3PYB6_STANL|nr:cation:proton antiporter [Stackebrandtia nassauensis]ADD41483.1 sodium/hydrogen exchanger [Stackebrandtia nassauensis DSM 44728]